jgi:hypothetical protein
MICAQVKKTLGRATPGAVRRFLHALRESQARQIVSRRMSATWSGLGATEAGCSFFFSSLLACLSCAKHKVMLG